MSIRDRREESAVTRPLFAGFSDVCNARASHAPASSWRSFPRPDLGRKPLALHREASSVGIDAQAVDEPLCDSCSDRLSARCRDAPDIVARNEVHRFAVRTEVAD